MGVVVSLSLVLYRRAPLEWGERMEDRAGDYTLLPLYP